MKTTFKSRFLDKRALTISLLILGIFAGVGFLLFMNAAYRDTEWIILVDSPFVKYGFVYLVGILIIALYFLRDYYFVNDLEVSFKDDTMLFKGKWINKDFHIGDLRDFRPSRVIYGWFKMEKHILRFKDHRDKRKYQMFLILNKDEALKFEQALVEARKSFAEKN